MVKWRFVSRRFLSNLLKVFLVATVTFGVLQIVPGGPFATGQVRPASPQIRLDMEARYGLDTPAWKQYLIYMRWLVLRFDFGPSLRRPGQTVNDLFFGSGYLAGVSPVTWSAYFEAVGRFLVSAPVMVSAQLWLLAAALAFLIGVPLGVLSALKQNVWIDHVVSFVSTVGGATPNALLGIILILVFAVRLGWLPAYGWGADWRQMLLPVIVLGIGWVAVVTEAAREGAWEVVRLDEADNAQDGGKAERVVPLGYVLRSGLASVATAVTLPVTIWLVGSCLAEWVFNIPGMGQVFLLSVQSRDYSVIMGGIILYTMALALFNLLMDIAYTYSIVAGPHQLEYVVDIDHVRSGDMAPR